MALKNILGIFFRVGNILDFISLQLAMCRVAAVKRLPILHHSADYLFFITFPFGVIALILVAMKIEYHLSQC